VSRVGLGCMRLSTDDDRDETRALATISAALEHGVVWFDTARAYGRDDRELGHNERLIARAVGKDDRVRLVTKCGMSRPAGRWEPDGRASAVLASARASSAELGRPPDVLLLHAPDPRVPLATSVRALVRARTEGSALTIGLSNVSRAQLESLGDVEISAVQVALGAFDDTASRGGVLAWCKERRVTVLAHSPLGGPSRAGKLARDPALLAIARRHPGATPAMIVIAYLLALSDGVVPLVGARRPASVASALAAARIVLDDEDLASLDARFPGLAMTRCPPRAPPPGARTAEVVLVMGVAGSGKSRLAESYVARGYERLNRDTLGGTLAGIAKRLGERLEAGARRFVLDNTYVTRASRSEVVRVAHAAGAAVRCVHVETPAPEVSINVVTRMLQRHGELLGGSELAARAKKDPGLFVPNVVARMHRTLERPTADEGFASIEIAPFQREHPEGRAGIALPIDLVIDSRAGLHAGADALLGQLPRSSPLLVFGWRESANEEWRSRAREALAAAIPERIVEVGICPHPAGPAVCWCRPPLPGLWIAFARRHGVDPRISVFVTRTPSHRAMAEVVGAKTLHIHPDERARR
jgi:aryl-alcohol dehydrogenase-like predicted oxidoreductase/predicted kinase